MPHVIRGEWRLKGYRQWRDDLTVAVRDGRVWLTGDSALQPGHDKPLTLNMDGEIVAWGVGTAFIPDTGEVERIACLGGMIPASPFQGPGKPRPPAPGK